MREKIDFILKDLFEFNVIPPTFYRRGCLYIYLFIYNVMLPRVNMFMIVFIIWVKVLHFLIGLQEQLQLFVLLNNGFYTLYKFIINVTDK